MFISTLILFIVFLTNILNSSCEISDKRLCVDDKCSVPVSLAKTLLRYSSPEPEGLSFAPNQEVVIFSKEAGSETNLWGAEINGKRGYVPKNLVREYRILKKPTKLVATRLIKEPQVPNTSINDVKPDKPLEPYDIIDGTKFYISPLDEKIDSQDNLYASEVPDKASEQEVSEVIKTEIVDTLSDKGASKVITSELVDKPSEADASNIVTSEELDKSSEQGSFELVNDNKPKEINPNYSSSAENDTQNNKSTTEGSNTLSFTTYSLSVENNLLSNFQSSSDDPNKSSSQETSSTKEETVVAEIPSPITHSSAEGKSVDERRPLTVKDAANEEAVLTQETSSSAEYVSEESAMEVPSLSDETSAADLSSSSQTVQELLTEEINSFVEKSQIDLLETKLKENLSKDLKVESKEEENSYSEPILFEEKVSTEQQNDIEQEKLSDISKEDKGSSINIWPPANIPLDNVKYEIPINSDQIKESSLEVTIKNSEPLNNNEDLKEQGDNIDNNPPPTLLPIFPPFPGVLNDVVTPAPNAQNSEEQLIKHSNIDKNELAKELNNNPSFLDNESKENESGESLNSIQQNTMLPKADLSQPFEDKTIIQESQSAADNQGYLSSNINDFNNENDKISDYNEESYQQSLESDIAQKEPKNDNILGSDQIMSTDYTITEKNMLSANENTDQTQSKEPVSEESPGIFSMLTSFFDWSGTPEEYNENSEIDKIDERNLKCDANIDQFSFNLNSNLMMHLITTIVVFVTFLLFYLSVNKHRIESPLVAKINQLEKDLLVMVKEREVLGEMGISDYRNDSINSEELVQLNQKLGQVCSEKENLEVQLSTLREELDKRDNQIESLEKELETSTEVGLELNRLISEVLDPSTNGSEKLKENVEQFQKQLQEQTEVIKSMSARLKAKELENVELLLEIEETKKNAASVQEGIKELVEKVTSIEREKDAQQTALQNEIKVYQSNHKELFVKNEILNDEIQVLKTKLANSEREIDLRIKECNSLKESFKDISSMKNDNKKLNSVLDTISMKAEYEQMKSDLEKYVLELQHNQSEKAIIENKYQSILQEITELKNKYQEIDKEKLETDMKLEVLNNYFKKKEMELQEEVLKYKSIWDAKEGEATSTTERIKLLQEEIENYKTQNEALKQEILSQEIALKSQITVLEKKAHENWVTARQSERKLEDARQEAAQLRNRLTFRQRNINDEMVQNGLDQNDTTMSSQPSMYSPASPPLFFDSGRDQVTKSPIPGLPPFLPPPPGAPFVPPPVPNLSGMPMPPPFMPPPPAGFPGDHRPPPLGRMSSPPIKSRYSPDTSAFSPYDRGSPSPIYDSEYGSGPYNRNYSPYNSEDDRRGYRNRSPSPIQRTKMRPSKNSFTTPNVKRSNESLDKTNSKKSNMV